MHFPIKITTPTLTVAIIIAAGCGGEPHPSAESPDANGGDASATAQNPVTQQADTADSAGALAPVPDDTACVYALSHPGLGFCYLPEGLEDPVEGDLLPERGSVVGSPNPLGVDYRIDYQRTGLESPVDKEQWLGSRLENVVPPELRDRLLVAQPEWREGSMLSEHRTSRSVGLVIYIDFNIVDEGGGVQGRGRTYGVFRNGYATMVMCLAPYENWMTAFSELDSTIDRMHLTRKD